MNASVAALSVLAVACAAGTSHAQATFRAIAIPPGGEAVYAYAVSADGSVVAGAGYDSVGAIRAFRWTAAGGTVFLPHLSGDNGSEGYALSQTGQVLVGRSVQDQDGTSQACRWSPASPTGLGDLPGSEFYSVAWSCSSDGQTVVGTGTSDALLSEAFVRSPGGVFTGLGSLPGGDWSEGYGISADGSVVVGASTDFSLGFQAVWWSAESGMVGIGVPAGCYDSYAYNISPDGSVIVGEGNTPDTGGGNFTRGFRWTFEAGCQALPFCSTCTGTSAYAASDHGSVIVGAMDNDLNQPRAMIWDEAHGTRFLQGVLAEAGLATALAGWTLTEANAVSPDGRFIAGDAVNPAGFEVGFLAFLPGTNPPPACYANCDSSTATPVLNVQDFSCFLARFAAGDPYANCDQSTAAPVLNVQDFSCFLQRFATGCP